MNEQKQRLYTVTFKPHGAKRRKTIAGQLQETGRTKAGRQVFFFKRTNKDGTPYTDPAASDGSEEYFILGEKDISVMEPVGDN